MSSGTGIRFNGLFKTRISALNALSEQLHNKHERIT